MIFNLASGRCAAAAEILDSIDSAMLPLSAAEINGSSFESIGGIYIPSVVAGINASTGNKENAEEFLRVLFGTEVQDESLRDGFSVRSSSLDKWSGMEKSVSVSMSMGGEGIALEGEWPKQADRDMILAIVHRERAGHSRNADYRHDCGWFQRLSEWEGNDRKCGSDDRKQDEALCQ